jgi:hypothetical protein
LQSPLRTMVLITGRPTIHIGMVVGVGAEAGAGVAVGVGAVAGVGMEVGAVAGMEVGTAAIGTGNSIASFKLGRICSRALSSGAFFLGVRSQNPGARRAFELGGHFGGEPL